MAIFWNHIKGTGNAASNNDGLWTWIEWSKPVGITVIPTLLTDALSPEIKVKIGNGNPDGEDETVPLGNILTTKVDTNVYGSWNNYNTWNWCYKEDDKITNVLSILPQQNGLQINTPGDVTWIVPNSYIWSFKKEKENNTPVIQIRWDINSDNSEDNTWDSILNINNTGIIKTTKQCEALYFNATSDKRAKENITPATFSGLDLINKLSLYTFNYKNAAGTVPGILAQDLLEIQPEGLDLVDNIAATGENGDYMSIKEGKLIFVLMQAIKEQQVQIDELKAELKKLTK